MDRGIKRDQRGMAEWSRYMYGDKAETRDGSVVADEMGAYESGRGGGWRLVVRQQTSGVVSNVTYICLAFLLFCF